MGTRQVNRMKLINISFVVLQLALLSPLSIKAQSRQKPCIIQFQKKLQAAGQDVFKIQGKTTAIKLFKIMKNNSDLKEQFTKFKADECVRPKSRGHQKKKTFARPSPLKRPQQHATRPDRTQKTAPPANGPRPGGFRPGGRLGRTRPVAMPSDDGPTTFGHFFRSYNKYPEADHELEDYVGETFMPPHYKMDEEHSAIDKDELKITMQNLKELLTNLRTADLDKWNPKEPETTMKLSEETQQKLREVRKFIESNRPNFPGKGPKSSDSLKKALYHFVHFTDTEEEDQALTTFFNSIGMEYQHTWLELNKEQAKQLAEMNQK